MPVDLRIFEDCGHPKLDELRWHRDLEGNRSSFIEAAGYGRDAYRIDPSVVRGLDYYTGPVFEAELTFEVKDEKGHPVRFGSVGGGGRYDGLVERFTGQKVPATGFSIGISRLQAALAVLNKDASAKADGPVIVTVMEKERIADYQKMVQALREADIRAELYLGNPKKFGKQLEYADKRGSPCVVIQGSDEREAGEVTLKDLIEGAKAAEKIANHEEWKETRAAQVSVKQKRPRQRGQEDPRPPHGVNSLSPRGGEGRCASRAAERLANLLHDYVAGGGEGLRVARHAVIVARYGHAHHRGAVARGHGDGTADRFRQRVELLLAAGQGRRAQYGEGNASDE